MQLDAKAKRDLTLSIVIAAVAGLFFGIQLRSVVAALVGLLVLPAIVGLGAYAGIRKRLQRDAEFAQVAKETGWILSLAVRGGPNGLLTTVQPFNRGHHQVAHRVLSGRSGWMDFHLMDAEYTTGGGKSRQDHPVSAVAFLVPVHHNLTIVRETGFHKVADAFGAEDIDVEHDAFSRMFWVRSADPKTTYAVLHPKAIEFLLMAGPDWTWAWQGNTIVMSRPGRLEPQWCRSFVAQAQHFYDLLPRHLIVEHTTPAKPARASAPLSPPR